MAQDLDRRSAAAARVSPVLLGCLVGAALSLVVVPSTITFDPLTWATWAREIIHLNLDTNGGPAWKPLPVVVDVIFAPLGAAEKWVWLVVARAGALLGVVMAYRLARRLAGRWAGVIAAIGLLLSESFLDYLAPLGMSEPMLAGLILLACECHLEGKRGQAYGLLFASLLLRPETFPFFVGYSLFLWRRAKGSRPWIVALFASLPVFWLLPDYLSTGNWLRSEQRASMPTQGGPLLTGHPWLAVIESGFNAVVLPVVVGAVIALVFAGVDYARHRAGPEDRALQMLAVLCVGWLLEESVITQAHMSSGDQRYMIVAYAAGCVLAGAGWARFVGAATAWLAARTRPPNGAPAAPGATAIALARSAVIAVLLLASAPFVVSRLDDLSSALGEVPYQAHKYRELPALIKQAGGRGPILACGPITSDIYQMPALAWDLGVHQSRIVIATATTGIPARGTVFRTRTIRGAPEVPPRLGSPDFRVVAATAQWQLLSTCVDLPA